MMGVVEAAEEPPVARAATAMVVVATVAKAVARTVVEVMATAHEAVGV